MDFMNAYFDLKMIGIGGVQKMADIGLAPFFFILLSSLIASLFISHLYLRFYSAKGTGSTLHRAFPLLGVAITAIFISLQFSIPLSLGLLGALSIVRFRTPIKDPEEVGFILLVIATSLSCATFNVPFLTILMTVSILGMVIMKFDKKLFRKRASEGIAIIKVPTVYFDSHSEQVMGLIKKNIERSNLDSVLEDGAMCTLTYSFSKLGDQHVSTLRQQLKGISNEISLNLFYNNIES